MYFLELGGEDDAFAAWEAASAATGLRRIAPGLAIAGTIVTERVRGLAYTHRASELLGRTDADVESARLLLEASTLDREGTVAVRANDVRATAGVDTERAERVLGQVLVDRGYTVDLEEPDHVLRVAFSAGRLVTGATDPDDEDESRGERTSVCALGWLAVESHRDFGDRKPTDRPFFQPGSMDPLLARAIANVAGARPGATILDPMCGTGGVLIEAGLLGANVIGTDVQEKMVEGTRENLAHALSPGTGTSIGSPTGEWAVARADATAMPIKSECVEADITGSDTVDAVVFDAPYGRQSKIERHGLAELVTGALGEARRVAPRAVVVADRSWASLARDAGWEIEAAFERRVHRSLTRHVLVLE